MADFNGITIGTKAQIDGITKTDDQIYFEIEDAMETQFDLLCTVGQVYEWNIGAIPEDAKLEITMCYASGYFRNFTIYNYGYNIISSRVNFDSTTFTYYNDLPDQSIEIDIGGMSGTGMSFAIRRITGANYLSTENVRFFVRLIRNP